MYRTNHQCGKVAVDASFSDALRVHFKLSCSLLSPLFQLSDYLKENEAETLLFHKILLTHLNFETVNFLCVGKYKSVEFFSSFG